MINPAVRLAAARFTDNLVTDKTLADVAASYGLPLYVADPTQAERLQGLEGLLIVRLAERLADAEAAGFPRTIAICRREYEAALAAIQGEES